MAESESDIGIDCVIMTLHSIADLILRVDGALKIDKYLFNMVACNLLLSPNLVLYWKFGLY